MSIWSLSVRSRILSLAAVPAAGFLIAGGVVFAGLQMLGDTEASRDEALAIMDASQTLNSAAKSLIRHAEAYAARPSEALAATFESTRVSVEQAKTDLAAKATSDSEKAAVAAITTSLGAITTGFAQLATLKRALGAEKNDALIAELAANGEAIAVASEDIVSVADNPTIARAVAAASAMRIQASLWQAAPSPAAVDLYTEAFDRVGSALDVASSMGVPQITLDTLRGAATQFDATFGKVRRAIDMSGAAVSKLSADADTMSTALATMSDSARQKANDMQAIAERTRATVITASLALFLLMTVGTALFAWWIGRGIGRPLAALIGAMRRLAAGDVNEAVPHVEARDEIGDMARTVLIFRDNAIERGRLEGASVEARQSDDRRRQRMEEAVTDFRQAITAIIDRLEQTARTGQSASGDLTTTATTAERLVSDADQLSAASSQNVQGVASAAEELSASTNEIGAQIERASRAVGDMADLTTNTGSRIAALSDAARKIGSVIELINQIAGQTNLLALNATIEAARAGEAGKGFAVVAAEVKSLADQTARATQEIASQVQDIQSATEETVSAVASMSERVGNVRGLTTAIAAAIEEQGAATREITMNVANASREVQSLADTIAGVSEAVDQNRRTSGAVAQAADDIEAGTTELKAAVERFLATAA